MARSCDFVEPCCQMTLACFHVSQPHISHVRNTGNGARIDAHLIKGYCLKLTESMTLLVKRLPSGSLETLPVEVMLGNVVEAITVEVGAAVVDVTEVASTGALWLGAVVVDRKVEVVVGGALLVARPLGDSTDLVVVDWEEPSTRTGSLVGDSAVRVVEGIREEVTKNVNVVDTEPAAGCSVGKVSSASLLDM